MYNEHFGLKEVPFSIAPDPRYLYMSKGHQEALAHLLYGINHDGGFVLLTGEVGTGKTTVCRCLLEKVPEQVDVAFILNPKLTAGELLAALCDELGIGYPEGNTSAKVFVDRINSYLLDSHARGKRTVLIIEEAQNLSADVLEQLRLLTNLETNQRKLLQIVMLGQPELRDKLAQPELRQLSQRVTARYHLGPLSKNDIAAYVRHRIEVAGGRCTIFPSAVIGRLFRLSGGIPRLINVICDRALLGAYVQGRDRVDLSVVSAAAREVLGEEDSRGLLGRRRGLLAAVAITAVCMAVVFAVYAFSGIFTVKADLPGKYDVGGRSVQQRLDTLWWFGDSSRLWSSLPGHPEDRSAGREQVIREEGIRRAALRSKSPGAAAAGAQERK